MIKLCSTTLSDSGFVSSLQRREAASYRYVRNHLRFPENQQCQEELFKFSLPDQIRKQFIWPVPMPGV